MNKKNLATVSKKVALMCICLVGFQYSMVSQESAMAIMERVFNRLEPNDMRSELTMTLVDSKNKERVRQLKQLSAKFNDGDKKIMEFAGPADVKGTAFMNWSYKDGSRSDDQWIYLPALQRVRRISSEGKGDSFMGSDFSYDDLGARHPNKDEHRIIGAEKIDGEDCYLIESSPKDKNDTYAKTISWVSKSRDMGLKREFYDKKGNLLKTLYVKETKTIKDYVLIVKTEMHNTQKNHKTLMEFNNIEINTGVSNDQFTERSLERGIR